MSSSTSSSSGWECSRCTYYHKAPGTRCVMCDSLRVTREQMHDFVLGKTLPKKPTDEPEPAVKENHPPSAAAAPPPLAVPSSRPASSSSSLGPVRTIRNPYAKPKTSSGTVPGSRPQQQQQQGMQSTTRPVPEGRMMASSSNAATRPPQIQQQSATAAWDPQRVMAGGGASSGIGGASSSVSRPQIGPMHPMPAAPRPPSVGNTNQWASMPAAPRPPSAGNANQWASMPAASRPPSAGNANQWASMSSTSNMNNGPRPPSAGNTTAQANSNRNGARSNATQQHAANRPPQEKKNPFTMAVRPPPAKYVPGPVPLCPDTASDWIYPIHQAYPIRDYQLEISKTAVLYNTLVSLPTGLGKTLIASVVLYNYYRWFPTGKVIFLAPTLPLVNQQVKACYDIMGIPAQDTALLTGKVAAKDRQVFWDERRVFFCTPQTVQRDIDSGRCPAQRVVCVVLDEAHKATGSYAYTKVVEQLEAAGAKYRILGLSATPGTGIKQIQEVVTALRIQKIEARLEDDPSVKKYVHERHNEIVLVQQGSVITTIERLLNDLIAPLLERLRASNGLATVGGNASLTPWCIIRARDDYIARTQDPSLNPYFFATNQLVSLRSEIRRTGIGHVRMKLVQMKSQARGIISKIVKGKQFEAVWDAVMRASSDPNNVNESAEDRRLNNPKLLKLDEILTEHFERSKASGESSRAIVFSQWRESVREIVDVLSSRQPLLRPRHFVGQGKSTGGAKKQNVDQTCVSLKGMPQKEQQRVIEEFQEGKFNILVCTCIGEEGLDIGEVDLIVNYDSLRSPIRMIQRVGRTGRKRDGRVVCLVSEGAEQRTMNQSKAAEKTLGRALKRPDNFTIVRSAPLFPRQPVLRQVDMSVSNDFHLSQIGGNGGLAPKSRRDPKDATNRRPLAETMTNWRLSDAHESHREAILGNISFSTSTELQSSDGTFPQALRRRLLRARTKSLSSHRNRTTSSTLSLGISRSILLDLERAHGKQVDRQTLVNRTLRTARRSRRETGVLQVLFPLDRSAETDISDGYLFSRKTSLSSMPTTNSVEDRNEVDAEISSSSHGNGPSAIEENVPDESSRGMKTVSEKRPAIPLCLNGNSSPRVTAADTTTVENQESGMKVDEHFADHAECEAPDACNNGDHEPPIGSTEFRLPTQSDSSSSDDSGTDDEPRDSARLASTIPTMNDSVAGAAPLTEREIEKHPASLAPVPEELNDVALGESLRLPTQESSSSDDGSSGESSDSDHSSPDPPSKGACHPPAVIHVDMSTIEDEGKTGSDHIKSSDAECHNSSSRQEGMNSVHDLVNSSQVLVDTPDVQNKGGQREESHDLAARLASSSGAELTDTPPSSCNEGTTGPFDKIPLVSTKRNDSRMREQVKGVEEHPLTDTPNTDCRRTRPNEETKGVVEHPLTDTPNTESGRKLSIAHAARSSYSSDAVLTNTPQCEGNDRGLVDGSKTREHKEEVEVHPLMDTPDTERGRALPSHSAAIAPAVHSSYSSEVDLTNTPHSEGNVRMLPPPPRTTGSTKSRPLEHNHVPDDLVCAVCFDGASTKNNPIVMCDGPNYDRSCPIAVHKVCYSIDVSLDDDDVPWHCDACVFRQQEPDNSSLIQCRCCQKDDGPLKRLSDSTGESWYHPCCLGTGVDQDANCQYCFLKGGIRCAFDSCTDCSHAYCAISKSRLPWLVLAFKSEGNVSSTLDSSCIDEHAMYCPRHRNDVWVALQAVGLDFATTHQSARYIILPSDMRGLGSTSVSRKDAAPRKRLMKISETGQAAKHPPKKSNKRADEPGANSQETRDRKRRRIMQRFLDVEADIDCEDDVDGDYGEEGEARRIEEEEAFYDSFINDSSQLGYTQDALDKLDLNENEQTPRESGAVHRALDTAKERMNQFATPVFNRRMAKHARSHVNATPASRSHDEWDNPTPRSAPSDQKGLERMHFIRSVLEHHRNGGEAEDIEEEYHRIAQEASPIMNEGRPQPSSNPNGPIVMRYEASDSESTETEEDDDERKPQAAERPSSHSQQNPVSLTSEQLAMIEAKRQEALRRRQQLNARNA